MDIVIKVDVEGHERVVIEQLVKTIFFAQYKYNLLWVWYKNSRRYEYNRSAIKTEWLC